MYSKAFILVFLISVSFGDVPADFYRYDYTYNNKTDGWLKLHGPDTWDRARVICHDEGAILASPINDDIRSIMTTFVKHEKIAKGIFIGTHAIFSKGIFTSLEGVPFSRMNVSWGSDQPDNRNNSESCLIMLRNGLLADVNCEEVHPYICYRKKSDTIFNTDCGTVDNEYSFNVRTGSCYKFHNRGETWSNGYSTCQSEGGYLAIINDEEEAAVLKKLFSRYVDNSIFAKNKGNAFIGYRDWNKNGEWFTIHDETIQEAGYSVWAAFQPDNSTLNGVGEYCGSIQRDAKLDDFWCDEIAPFICEMIPNNLMPEQIPLHRTDPQD